MEVLEQLKQSFNDFKSANNATLENIKAMVKEQENGTKEGLKNAIAIAEKTAGSVQAFADRLLDVEQKLVDGIKSGKEPAKSLGQLVIESDEYKAFSSKKSKSMSLTVQANTLTGQSGSPAANNDTLTQADRQAGVIPGAFRRLRVKDLIPPGTTISNAIEATRELLFTNSAAETAEGASKPESTLTFELYSIPVVTIAHWIKVSKQVRDDAPVLMSYINNRLAYGVDLREETQIVAGNGTGQNLLGMTHANNRTAFTPTTGDNALDSLNRAKYALENSDYPPTAIIMNPATWGAIERTKVGTGRVDYVIGDPRNPMGPVLWGLPVVVTPSMTADKLHMAAYNIAFQYFTRQETTVELFEQDDTNAQKNLITVRAEKRGVLAGYRPASVLYGDLTL